MPPQKQKKNARFNKWKYKQDNLLDFMLCMKTENNLFRDMPHSKMLRRSMPVPNKL